MTKLFLRTVGAIALAATLALAVMNGAHAEEQPFVPDWADRPAVCMAVAQLAYSAAKMEADGDDKDGAAADEFLANQPEELRPALAAVIAYGRRQAKRGVPPLSVGESTFEACMLKTI